MTESDFALSAVKKEEARQATRGPDLEAGKASPQADDPLLEPDQHEHYCQRAPWLRAGVLGANDGLVSVASLMIGVGGGSRALHTMILAGQYRTESITYKDACQESHCQEIHHRSLDLFCAHYRSGWFGGRCAQYGSRRVHLWAVRSVWQSASTSL